MNTNAIVSYSRFASLLPHFLRSKLIVPFRLQRYILTQHVIKLFANGYKWSFQLFSFWLQRNPHTCDKSFCKWMQMIFSAISLCAWDSCNIWYKFLQMNTNTIFSKFSVRLSWLRVLLPTIPWGAHINIITLFICYLQFQIMITSCFILLAFL